MAQAQETKTGAWHLKDRLPSRWTRIDLQARDLFLLRILLEQKFLTRRQIQDHIFQGKARYAYLRLWKLRRFGFVKEIPSGFIPEGLYLATKQAHEYFLTHFLELPPPIPWSDARTVAHDLLATEIRFLFQKIGFSSSWISERVWRMGRSVRLWAPDAIISVGGDPFALEVECIQKMDRRYEDIFSRYQTDPEISACLYVTTETLVQSLMKRAQAYPKIYFTTQLELFGKKERAVFRSAQGRFLEISENLEMRLKESA